MAEGLPINSRAANKAAVFLGGGRITSALLAGFRLARHRGPIVVHDRNPEKLKRLRRQFRIKLAPDLKAAVGQAETIIIAVRPDSVVPLLDAVAHCGRAAMPRIAISLAAGIPLRDLRAKLPKKIHWVRAMPSPVCGIGCGLTALTFDRGVGRSVRKRVREFFGRLGAVVEIPESQFDAFTASYSPSHGYHALATLAAAGQDAGLNSKTALLAAAHALADGIYYWRRSGESLSDLMQEAATPGGTAAATMFAMDRANYSGIVRLGLAAGIRQARQNAKR